MKVILLDIDGVISLDGKTFDPSCIANLKSICEATKSVIVISSSRRDDREGFKRIINTLEDNGLTVISETLNLPIALDCWSDRIDEILEWVRRNKPSQWVCIDDICLLDIIHPRQKISKDKLEKHFVHCDVLYGITKEKANEAIKKLNKK